MRWKRGWQTARTREGTRRFWRGQVTLTLSEPKAAILEGFTRSLGVSGDQIVQAALDHWLEQYLAGNVPAPLAGKRTQDGVQRVKGTYHFTSK